MKKRRKKKCRCCKEPYQPDYRNHDRQRFCSEAECQQMSTKVSQDKWVRSPKGQGYFRSPHNSGRMQQWRKDHPDHAEARRNAAEKSATHIEFPSPVIAEDEIEGKTLQDSCILQPIDCQAVTEHLNASQKDALQDPCFLQPADNKAVATHVIDLVLQDSIDVSARCATLDIATMQHGNLKVLIRLLPSGSTTNKGSPALIGDAEN